MGTVVCFSQYFANKQNVRSLGNLIKTSVLKNVDSKVFCDLLFEGSLTDEQSQELLNVVSILKNNFMKVCKNDFANYFPKGEICPYLQPVDKEYIFNQSWQALKEIIPKQFYGSSHNDKIFKKLIRAIIFSMKRQHFLLEDYLDKWDFNVLPWNTLPDSSQKQILNDTINGISKYILAAIICLNFYVTTCKLNSDENRLYYFWKNQWQSFYDKQIYKMVFTKVIKKVDSYSLGKVSKKQHSYTKRKQLRKLRKDIPKLYLSLKANQNFRPIVCYKNNSQNSEKHKIKERLRFLRLLIGKPNLKMENQYNNFYTKWLNADKPKLYFIKTDLSNAFGCVNRETLSQIISERYQTILKNEDCVNKKKNIAQQYKDLVNELSKPFLIRAGSTVFKWTEGLVQGYKYSPALSELYYMSLDELYFPKHIKENEDQLKLFIRVVDDYLYVTDSIEDAHSFLQALTNYRNVNHTKTVVNFQHETIKFSEEISFLGYSYNTVNLQVSRASNIYSGQMCYKITFTSGILDLYKFIESRVGQSGIQISSHIFNLQYNNEDLIWKHVFTTYCMSANKFCTILAVLCSEVQMKNFLILFKKKVTVKLTNCIIDMMKKNKPKDYMFVYCINHFRYLSWKALYLVAKSTPKCIGLIPLINVEIAKTNCVLGKWREHASRIDTNGDPQYKSHKEVCRRTDLRRIFKEFDILPFGFECYHHKILK